jgi:hypothetical protein
MASDRCAPRHRFLGAIDPWKHGRAHRIPAEFVIVTARADPSFAANPESQP